MTDVNDIIREQRIIERKREWEHGDGGKGDDCQRRYKPVHTNTDESPRICRQYDCDNEHWYSRGYVQRDKNTKKVLVREHADGRKEKVNE